MVVLANDLIRAATALAESLPPGVDLDAGLRSGHEGERLKQLKLVGELRRMADAVGARLAGDLSRRDDEGNGSVALRQGDRSLADTVSRAAGVPPATAQSWCRVGAAITSSTSLTGEPPPARPRVGAALDAGALSVEAAGIIAAALSAAEPYSTLAELECAEKFLVREAPALTLPQLGRVCVALQDRLNPDGVEPREELLRQKAGVRRVQRRDGSVDWILTADPESDGWLKAAVDAQTAPRRAVRFEDPDDPAEDPDTADTRTLGQRQLAAFVQMAKKSLADDGGAVAGLPATMLVTVPLETLRTGTGSASIAGVDTPISAGTARRLACQANIIPVVLGGASEVLDVGRSSRLFTRGQRLAMAVRDRGCTWPGCEAPPGWCEAAHAKNPWHAGGKTNLADGALLCSYHHHRLDNDGWTLDVRDGVPWFIPPPWVDPTGTPRRGGRERLPEDLAD